MDAKNFNDNNENNNDSLLGGLDIDTTREVEVPDNLINQVIGQEKAVDIIKKAAEQRRHVMMIGSPGTGKSMLAKAMSELLPKEEAKDILVYPNEDDENNPNVKTVPAGKGKEIVDIHEEETEKEEKVRKGLMWALMIGVVGIGILINKILMGVISAVAILIAYNFISKDINSNAPELLVDNSDSETAPFRDATGSHSGSLLGDVRHDPFQSGGLGTPAHKRIESGAIHEANNGVLFIDEINTLDVKDQQKLMTAIQEGEFPITGQSQRSSGAMVQTDPVPTNFILVAAGNIDAMENMHPALRSRIKGYGYEVHMDETIEDTQENRRKFVRFIAQEVQKENNIPHFKAEAAKEIIKEAKKRSGSKDSLTLELRDLGGLIRASGDVAIKKNHNYVTKEDVKDAKEKSRSIEQQISDKHINKKKDYSVTDSKGKRVGRVNGLAVMGDDSGIVKPISAEVTHGDGKVIATGKLQDIAEESVQNVSAIIKNLTGKDINNLDVHIQFIQSYQGVNGDSASVTIATAVLSALENIEIDQNLAMTGSLTVRGEVLPVGGVTHKIEAAAKSGLDKVIIPKQNEEDVIIDEKYKNQIEIIPVENISEVLNHATVNKNQSNTQEILSKLSNLKNINSNINLPQTTKN